MHAGHPGAAHPQPLVVDDALGDAGPAILDALAGLDLVLGLGVADDPAHLGPQAVRQVVEPARTGERELQEAEPLEQGLGPGDGAAGRPAHQPCEARRLGVDHARGRVLPERVRPGLGAREPRPEEVVQPALELVDAGRDLRLPGRDALRRGLGIDRLAAAFLTRRGTRSALPSRPESHSATQAGRSCSTSPARSGGTAYAPSPAAWACSSSSARPCLQGCLRLGQEQRKAGPERSTATA